MNHTDSKMTKSLQYHNLQNLVFQKRQRKTIVNPLPTFNSKQPIKPKQKKIVNNQQKSKQKIHYNTQNNKSEKQIKTKNDKQSKKKTKIIKKYQKMKQLKQIKIKGKNQLQNKKFKRILRKKNVVKKKQIIQQIQVIDVKNRKKQQKISPIEFQNRLQQNLTIKRKGRPKKIIQNIENQQNQKSQKKQLPIISSSWGSQIHLNNIQLPKMRQAKLNALKKYSQKQIFPQEQQQKQKIYYSSKKKRIAKVSTEYQINRIFRKQPKLDLNAIEIPVKLNKLSLNLFVNKFGTFDVIHTSLPLSILFEISQLDCLMIKGFIFLWIQRGQISLAYHLMNKLGYDVIDQIIWVKCNQNKRTVQHQPITTEQAQLNSETLFKNSKSTCMVGYKCPIGQKAQYRTKISNNLIFAQPFQNPIQKPNQIFQIADLLMPGSRKLQLGGPPQKGWLSLTHRQLRLHKCYKCLKQLIQRSKIFYNQRQGIINSVCNRCFKYNIPKNNEKDFQISENSDSSSENQILQQETIEIIKFKYVPNQAQLYCRKCQRNLLKEAILCNCYQNQYFCKSCFCQQYQNHLKHEIQRVQIKKSIYVNKVNQKCSNCQKNTLVENYYQCLSNHCKNKKHILCSQCFWKTGYQIFNQELKNQMIKRKNDGLHQFKLRKITCYPNQKLTCFCKKDLVMPYYICQTCVGWKWCGKCKITQNNFKKHQINDKIDSENINQHKVTLIC